MCAGRKSLSDAVVIQRDNVPPGPCYSWGVGALRLQTLFQVCEKQMIKGEFFTALDTCVCSCTFCP